MTEPRDLSESMLTRNYITLCYFTWGKLGQNITSLPCTAINYFMADYRQGKSENSGISNFHLTEIPNSGLFPEFFH